MASPIKYRLGILGYGTIAELSWYLGFRDQILIEALDRNAQLDPRWSGSGFIYPPGFQIIKSKSPSISQLRYWFRDRDLILGISFQELGARVAEQLGIPYISGGVVSVFLPEGIQYWELIFPQDLFKHREYLIPISRHLQLKVALDLVSGRDFPLAPIALMPTQDGIREINLKFRS